MLLIFWQPALFSVLCCMQKDRTSTQSPVARYFIQKTEISSLLLATTEVGAGAENKQTAGRKALSGKNRRPLTFDAAGTTTRKGEQGRKEGRKERKNESDKTERRGNCDSTLFHPQDQRKERLKQEQPTGPPPPLQKKASQHLPLSLCLSASPPLRLSTSPPLRLTLSTTYHDAIKRANTIRRAVAKL